MIDGGASRVTEMVNEQVAPARILSKFTHSYDAIGNRTSRREVVGGFSGSGATDGVETLYEYDDLDRLTRSTQPEERFEYDLVGNRTEHGQSYNGLNQLTSDGKYAYTFDLNGNRTSKRDIVTNEVTEYQWDSDDQMTRVTMKNGAGVTTKILRLYYDGLGRRKEKQYQDNEVMARSYTRKYILEGDTVLQERDAVGNVVATYLHGPGIDDPITMLRDVDGNGSINHDNEVWHLTKDTLGSIKDLTNPTGQVVQRYRHAPYGLQTLELDESRLDSKEIENPFGFTGHWLDKETGLICADFRCLDPNTGTWISPDPLGFGGEDVNLYRYVKNSPTDLRDPTGEFLIAPILIGAATGAGFELFSQLVFEGRDLACLDYGAILQQAVIGGALGGVGQLIARTKFVGQALQRALPRGDILKTSSGLRFGVGRVGVKDVKTAENILGLRKFPGAEGRSVLRIGLPGKGSHLDLLDLGPAIK